jgi:Do/DeqQ family serine protease
MYFERFKLKTIVMKGKYLLGGLIMALLGAIIALFAYTKIYGNPQNGQQNYTANDHSDTSAMLTSYQGQAAPVDFTLAAEKTVHAVVHVRTTAVVGSQAQNPIMEFFYGDKYKQEPQKVQGFGSGVIISPDGFIVTNNHVIEDAESVEVKLNDNRIFPAEVVGRDPSTDLALLKIKANNLEFIKYGDSEKLKVGEWVLAVGNPFNLTSTVTAGIVSAKGRNLGILESEYRIESFIQTDAALNMGNSGGALVNTQGQLVGITSAILSPSGAYAGNSFAIPVEIVQKVIEDIREFGEVQRAIIGVNIREVTADDADKEKLKEIRGAYVEKVIEKSSGEEAGLKEGDIITAFNGVQVNTVSDLQVQVSRFRPGDKATITFFRNGSEKTVPIKLKNAAGNTDVVTADNKSVNVLGARLEALTDSDKKALDIDYGVKIAEISEGRLRDIGMRRGNIILSINGQKIKTPSDARDASAKGLKSIEGIQSDGTIFNFQFGR